jgi:H+/Cl- antiporter ClcA
LIIGAVCGLIGATWICLNTYVHMFRKDYLSHPIMKVVEVSILAFITASFAFWLPFVIT